jgi:hypothetical protein
MNVFQLGQRASIMSCCSQLTARRYYQNLRVGRIALVVLRAQPSAAVRESDRSGRLSATSGSYTEVDSADSATSFLHDDLDAGRQSMGNVLDRAGLVRFTFGIDRFPAATD